MSSFIKFGAVLNTSGASAPEVQVTGLTKHLGSIGVLRVSFWSPVLPATNPIQPLDGTRHTVGAGSTGVLNQPHQERSVTSSSEFLIQSAYAEDPDSLAARELHRLSSQLAAFGFQVSSGFL
ncbi:hypothetical protein CHARACLAT_022231 [Characodon lateralis]|uniref:Uncharacterized protein n=1 Tax=Characodon lateralis TaxID=208331 RepID=A0ABU7DX84_9TELE|nr:hypothetical protein [Characodon lateralis]